MKTFLALFTVVFLALLATGAADLGANRLSKRETRPLSESEADSFYYYPNFYNAPWTYSYAAPYTYGYAAPYNYNYPPYFY